MLLLRRFSRLLVICAACFFVPGCGVAQYPVTGSVLLEGKAFTGKEGAVVLRPDAGKGNTANVAPLGVLQPDGRYNILTNGQPGAPAGWYKVVILATEAGSNPNEEPRRVLNARYEKEATTPLAIEVVAGRNGDYDLQLSR